MVADTLVFSDSSIDRYKINKRLVKFIKKKFNRISKESCSKLISLILNRYIDIKVDMFTTAVGFKVHNANKLDDDGGKLKIEIIRELKEELETVIKEKINKDIEQVENEIQKKDGEEVYELSDNHSYEAVRKKICDIGVGIKFMYNYKTSSLQQDGEPENSEVLQRSTLQIVSQPYKFTYNTELVFYCPQCSKETRRKAYEVVSTNRKNYCDGVYEHPKPNHPGDVTESYCGKPLSPDYAISEGIECYFYDIFYFIKNNNGENEQKTGNALFFEELTPGIYDCVFYKVNSKQRDIFHIIAIQGTKQNKLILPPQLEGENYVFTLVKCFDTFIQKQTGLFLWGLYPIKISLVLQKGFNILGFNKIANIQLVGDEATGKTDALSFFGFLLDKHLHMNANGVDISIPALRGTPQKIDILGENFSYTSKGYLGAFQSIYLDEANQNPELVKQLKSFLYSLNYSYNKAYADGTKHSRTAHINLGENIDIKFLGEFRGSVRKAFRESTESKSDWDEGWDLHLPLWRYVDNKVLFKVIDEKRTAYKNQKKFWIDGAEISLHQRFPFFFYLTKNKEKEDEYKELQEVVKCNSMRPIIRDEFKLLEVLKNDDIDNFFIELKKYLECDDKEIEWFNKVDNVLHNYKINYDPREYQFWYQILKLSRIINKRFKYTEADIFLVQYLIENTNCKIDVKDTNTFSVIGPPDVTSEEKLKQTIEDENLTKSEFGITENLSDEEFK